MTACQSDDSPSSGDARSGEKPEASFELISKNKSGVDFVNQITETWPDNVVTFGYMYAGGGVAIGDINNDDLPDLYFTGNQVNDELYLNKGDFEFEKVTRKAGIKNDQMWTNGVTMVDVNTDGYLDIYVCKGGFREEPAQRANLLYINQGDGTFINEAAKRGLEDQGFSVMSNFFDADNDGDLDVYVINRPNTWRNKAGTLFNALESPRPEFSDHLYINDGSGTFTEESKSRGIESYFNFGLSVTTADLNEDGWMDIYVSNDYLYNDICFINQGDGTFKEKISEVTNHVAFYAMGTDIADLDNDGLEDIYTVEMLPEDYWRAKVTMAPMVSEEKFVNYFERLGFHVQYMHNNFQWNRGNGFFSEISQKLGIHKTDWSWSCLMQDFNHDGRRDIYVTNGYKRDMFDNDLWDQVQTEMRETGKTLESRLATPVTSILEKMPSNPLANYMYSQTEKFEFDNVSKDWGLQHQSFSNGAATGDLDNDGDLDLVVNNIDSLAFIYKNNQSGGHYIRIKLKGPEKNPMGLGAKVKVRSGDQQWVEQFKTVRGYLSSVEPIVHIGLGSISGKVEVEVEWQGGGTSTKKNVSLDQEVVINFNSSQKGPSNTKESPSLFTTYDNIFLPNGEHTENRHKDFEQQVLLPHKLSQEGPALATGDINGDGIDDVYLGGSTGFPGQVFIGSPNGTYSPKANPAFDNDKFHEDVDAAFLDADRDGDLDLYVVSGGSEFPVNSEGYTDRFYLNDGSGNFSRSGAIPELKVSGGCVEVHDFNQDGRPDLFVGGRIVPELYPTPSSGFILLNTPNGFVDVTDRVVPGLKNIGMITDATWMDVNNDGFDDLILAGEWMPITIFVYENQKMVNRTADFGLSETTGWWFTIEKRDIDSDGDMDLIAGNLGKNYKHKASKEKPFHVYSKDFDDNGTYDVVLAKYDGDRQVPVRGRECTSQQLPEIKNKFPTYRQFAEAGLDKILGEEKREALHLKVYTFESMIFENTDSGFVQHVLPFEAQISTVRSILFDDVNKDGKEDLILAGNLFPAEPETTRADASIGSVLIQQDNFEFEAMGVKESGVFLPYDVRDMSWVKLNDSSMGILVASNNDKLRLLKRQK